MTRLIAATLFCVLVGQTWGEEPAREKPAREKPAREKPAAGKPKEIAGTADHLRSLPKPYATLQGADPVKRTVTLLAEGEKEAKTWPLTPDAEVRVNGWWGRLDQLQPGDRVWVWLQTDRKKKPVAVTMIADEPSEQDLHGPGVTLVRVENGQVVVKAGRFPERSLPADLKGKELKAGGTVYVQASGERARLVLTPDEMDRRRADQKELLRQRWVKEGLPCSVSVLHRFNGSMEVLVDHEAMRWARSLRQGDKVSLTFGTAAGEKAEPIDGVVRYMRPWREKTLVGLVVRGADQTDLTLGQRAQLVMAPPSAEVEKSALPADIDLPRPQEERVEWILASIYCTCMVRGDGCAGHYFTLASCNPNTCGMPKMMRKRLGEMIEKGMSDREIIEKLHKDQGPSLLRPHMLR